MAAAQLALTRCRNHPDREAAARCPDCRLHFCRECVVEHQGRLLCAACLAAGSAPQQQSRRGRLRGMLQVLGTFLGFLLVWLLMFAAGDLLTRIPESFHGTSTATETAATQETAVPR